jgi:hypothetical protein
MKTTTQVILGILLLALASWSGAEIDTIAPGEQPQICSDNKGIIDQI